MIKITKKDRQFRALRLAENIISDAPEHQAKVRILNDELICTESKRMMLFSNFSEGLEAPVTDGFYFLCKERKSYILIPDTSSNESYPNIDRIIPKDTTTIEIRNMSDESAFVYSVYTTGDLLPSIKLELLKPLYKAIEGEIIALDYTVKNFPIMFTNGELRYIVMMFSL